MHVKQIHGTEKKDRAEQIILTVYLHSTEAIVFLENNYLTEYDDLYSDPDVIEIYRNFLIKYEVDNLDEYLEYLE